MVHSNQMPIATNSDKIILNSEKDTKEFAKNILNKNHKTLIASDLIKEISKCI